MATISATLNEDLYVLQSVYRSEKNFEAKMLIDEIINLSDQFSKLQLPVELFFERLIASARNVGSVYGYSETEMEPLNETIEIILEHSNRY
jgi:hypothetical protein